MKVTIKVDSKNDWQKLYLELYKNGLIEDISIREINVPEDRFPVEFQVDISSIIKTAGNPLLKPFRKAISESLRKSLVKIIC